MTLPSGAVSWAPAVGVARGAAAAALLMLAAIPAASQTAQEVLEATARSSPASAGARAVVNQRRAQVDATIAETRPEVELSAGRGRAYPVNSIGGARTVGGILSGRHVLYDGGRARADIRAAEEEAKASIARAADVEAGELLDAVTAWLEWVASDAELRLRLAGVSALEEEFSAARKRFELGDATLADVALADARLATARTRVAAASAAKARYAYEVERLSGLVPREGAWESLPEGLPSTPAEAESRAIRNAALRQEIHQRRAQQHRVRGQQARSLPVVTLEPVLKVAAPGGGEPWGQHHAVSLRVEADLIDGGLNLAKVRRAQAELTRKDAEHAEKRAALLAAARSTFASLRAATARVNTTGMALTAARLARDEVAAGKAAGERRLLDLLNAEEELVATALSHAKALRDERVAAYTLLAVTGGLETGPRGEALRLPR